MVTEAVITAAAGKIVTIGIAHQAHSARLATFTPASPWASKALPMLTPWTQLMESRTPLPHRSTWIPVSTPGTRRHVREPAALMLKHLSERARAIRRHYGDHMLRVAPEREGCYGPRVETEDHIDYALWLGPQRQRVTSAVAVPGSSAGTLETGLVARPEHEKAAKS